MERGTVEIPRWMLSRTENEIRRLDGWVTQRNKIKEGKIKKRCCGYKIHGERKEWSEGGRKEKRRQKLRRIRLRERTKGTEKYCRNHCSVPHWIVGESAYPHLPVDYYALTSSKIIIVIMARSGRRYFPLLYNAAADAFAKLFRATPQIW